MSGFAVELKYFKESSIKTNVTLVKNDETGAEDVARQKWMRRWRRRSKG